MLRDREVRGSASGPATLSAESIAVVSEAEMEDRPGDPKPSTSECQERTLGGSYPNPSQTVHPQADLESYATE